MSDASFEARLARIGAVQPEPSRQPQHNAPLPQKARNRRERLQLALAHLSRAGITGNYAYAPAFRGLAKMGLIMKPLHFWSYAGLVTFSWILFAAIFAGTVVACLLLGVMPSPVRGLISAGPTVWVVVNSVMALAFAVLIKAQVKGADLPRWKDL